MKKRGAIMKEGIGAKGGKKDRILRFRNRKRKQKQESQELEKRQQQQQQEKNKKQKEIDAILLIDSDSDKEEKIPIFKNKSSESKTNISSSLNLSPPIIEEPSLKKQTVIKAIPPTIHKDKKKTSKPVYSPPSFLNKQETKKKAETISSLETQKIADNTDLSKTTYSTSNPKVAASPKETKDTMTFVEKQVIKILEQDIEEKKYQLKKMDSELYTIQKNIDSITDKEELKELEQEVQQLMEMIEQIKSQMISLEKMLALELPVEEPDHYLIYLVEEYKSHRHIEIELEKSLQENPRFQFLIDTVIEMEEKQKIIQEKIQEKKGKLELEEEQINKLNEDVVDLEEMNQKITKLLKESKKMMEEITQKVNETVHITQRVEIITRQVDHTMLELFLLMGLLKHNLSIKNNAIAAATAMLALDMIIKMTTPISEKKVIFENDVKDYRDWIEHCTKDTNFLEEMIDKNIDQISSIRYIFEHDYSACDYLSSYQSALEKLMALEEEMKERKKDVSKMKKEMQTQLEKNNAKVNKYNFPKVT